MRYLRSIYENNQSTNIPTFSELIHGIRNGKIKASTHIHLPHTDDPICNESDIKIIDNLYYTYSFVIINLTPQQKDSKDNFILIFEDGEPLAVFPKTDGAIKFESALVFWNWDSWSFEYRGVTHLPKVYRKYDLIIFNLDSHRIEFVNMETPYKFQVEADEFTFEMPYKKVIKCREKRTGIVKLFDLKVDEFFGPPSKVRRDKI